LHRESIERATYILLYSFYWIFFDIFLIKKKKKSFVREGIK
jgi:hypothetical protein